MSIITIENTDTEVDSEDIIYSKGYSRPSKSTLDPELYSKYKSVKDSFNLFEECLSYIFCSELLECYVCENCLILTRFLTF